MIALLLGASLLAPPQDDLADWTVLFYGASDNDSEQSFVPDVTDMVRRMPAGDDMRFLYLVDRSPDYSDRSGAFGDDFADTRLFRAVDGRLTPLPLAPVFADAGPGFEANTGAAETLAAFVRYAKAAHPARHTALVLYSHGGGYSFCPDETSGGDELFAAELTDVLGEEESVDLIVFDVCSMGGVENAYQWRPGNGRFFADYMVATPNAGFPFPWPRIFSKLREDGGSATVAPADLSPERFGRLVVDEMQARRTEMLPRAPRMAEELSREAMALLDLSQAEAVKEAVDGLARALTKGDTKDALEAIRGDDELPGAMNYVMEQGGWGSMPYVDLFDLAEKVALASFFDEEVSRAAEDVLRATDALVVHSFGMSHYESFQPGKNGVYITFPDGDAETLGTSNWARMRWYTPDRRDGKNSYGNYAWCRDGATRENGVVENWFELLDTWFDANDEGGGANGYRP